jgi:hypothetical protein
VGLIEGILEIIKVNRERMKFGQTLNVRLVV